MKLWSERRRKTDRPALLRCGRSVGFAHRHFGLWGWGPTTLNPKAGLGAPRRARARARPEERGPGRTPKSERPAKPTDRPCFAAADRSVLRADCTLYWRGRGRILVCDTKHSDNQEDPKSADVWVWD